MSLLGSIVGAVTKIGKKIFGGAGKAGPAIGGAITGASLVSAVGPGAAPRRRRSRKRITDRELQELIMLKAVVGPRSPLLTIAGIKMLGRGG